MPESLHLSAPECERLLRGGAIGRVALSTPEGPQIVPVRYAVFEDTIVIRTSAYSALGTYGRNAMLAFEVDHLDQDRRIGWSVVARGRSWGETDATEVARIRAGTGALSRSGGNRNVYLRIRWNKLSGRALAPSGTAAPIGASLAHRTRSAPSSSPHTRTGT
jgi:uncharacterized protein